MAQSVVSAKLGPFRKRVDTVLADMAQKRISARLWAKDHRLWKPDPTEIDNRLGWLTVAEQMEERVGPLTAFATSVLLAKADPGSYLAVLSYVRPSAQVDAVIRTFRKSVMTRYRFATTAGYGPRYLHSTGQLHKGGPRKRLFLQLLGDMSPDVMVPNASYTFGILAQGQAVGDLQSLEAHQRPVVRVQLARNTASSIKTLTTNTTRGRRRASSTSRTSRRKR
jgi:hypothetical protein